MVQPAQVVGVSPAGSGPFAHLPKFVGEWGDADDAGLQKHLACKGRGCTGCKREGYRRT